MNQISSIKERLKNFNDTEFQELCDSFLSLRNRGYKAYSRTGGHEIKQKTTRGTPDSFIQMPNGQYLFVESTTTAHKGKTLIKKLQADILGCLEVHKTKISVNKIQEIILCYNSNLKAVELEEVNKLAVEKMGKPPMHYNLDRLATEIFFHHKNLAHDFLGLPLDTGQVVSLKKFIEEYDNGKQKLSSPLAGVFLHRNNELNDVRNKLAASDIVIISGPAGVGKSKLALEAIDQFVQSHLDYNAYAISPKGADILGDLGAYFEGEDSSILLVDDVNRVDKFEQVLGFYSGVRRGKLKLVLTVRDYALENVREWLSTYQNSIVEIGGFGYEEIKAIIKYEPFGIRNGSFQNKICSIAKGNARLAVMMAMIAKTSNLESLNNVSDLFEKYFETFVRDENAFKDKSVLKALGIISFFYTLPYNDSELLDSVANSFSISCDELREAFDRLHNLDLIELNYQHVRIGEQNLSTYFFYKVFIKDRLLSFESLWDNYFERLEHCFKDTVYPTHQNFGKEFVTKEIKPALLSYWSTVQLDELKSFRFLNFAWEFLPDECLFYLEAQINDYAPLTVEELKTKYEINDFASPNKKEKHLHLLANFFKEPAYFMDALELSLRFTQQDPRHLPQLIYHIDENFSFIEEDYYNHFERQFKLVDYLIGEIDKGKLQALTFFAVAKTLLKMLRWSYENEKEAEQDDTNIVSVKKSRGKILKALNDYFSNYPEDVFAVVLGFLNAPLQGNKYTIEFDLSYLIPLIDKNMDRSNFRHCYYVSEMIRYSIKEKCSHDDFKRLKLTFTHPTYSLFELVNWDRRRGRDNFNFKDYKKFERLKIVDITRKLIFKSKDEVKQFIIQYYEILECNEIKIHSQHQVIDAIVKTNLINNNEIGFITFVELVRLKDKGRFNSDFFISRNAIDSLTAYPKLAERFWKAIEMEGLNEIWKLELLSSLPVELITEEYLNKLCIVLNDINMDFRIQHERLMRYEKLDPEILHKILHIVVNRIEEGNLKIGLREEYFVHVGNVIKDVDILKKAYLQQFDQEHHFDYNGEALLAILNIDSYFLLEFIKNIFRKDRRASPRDHKELTVIWELINVEEILDESIIYMANAENYCSFSEHFANVFFQNLSNNEERADKYLLRLIDKFSNQPKIIRVVFDIIYNSRKLLFEQAFRTYIEKNQDIEYFKEIGWMGSQVVYSGNAIIGAIKAAKWEKILNLVENANLGTKTRAVRNYIKTQRDKELSYAEDEKKRKFLSSF